MISVAITNEMLNRILAIEKCHGDFQGKRVLPTLSARLRKNSRKRSAHSSTKIEGNPLTEEQANRAIEDEHRHFLKPEEEVRNYYAVLQLLEERLGRNAPSSTSICFWKCQCGDDGQLEERLNLLMVDNRIPAGAKLY